MTNTPAFGGPGTRGLLERVETDSTVVGRDGVVDQLIDLLGRFDPAPVAVVGAPGSGRTTLMRALSHRLAGLETGTLAGAPVVRIDPSACLIGDREDGVRRAIGTTPTSAVLVIEDLDVLAGLGTTRVDNDLLDVVYGAALRPGHLIVTLTPASRSQLRLHHPRLAASLHQVDLAPLEGADLAALTERWAQLFTEKRGVEVPESVASVAAGPPSLLDHRAHPGLLFERLDGASTRAAHRGAEVVDATDLALLRPGQRAPIDLGGLSRRLKAAVRAQDHAVDRLVERLAVTRLQLDLNPERPDGVFLFAGPTGVGKTALARALSRELSGSDDRLIRLDMSEYEGDWAVSRLIGPQPGYVGYAEPDGWLTTRVRERPDAVVLLDEIEKAHPTVWSTFLQVFDAGRLTDARGNVAHFADTVIVLTSNMGSDAFDDHVFGFTDTPPTAAESEADVIKAIRGTMRPELVNRLDAVIVFQPLSADTIRSIAEVEIDRLRTRLAPRGYDIEVDDDVITLIADSGHDADFGARHLQRNIEQLLLVPLATAPKGRLRASVDRGGGVTWRTID